MSNRLRKNELCPIHKSLWCCGREKPAIKRQPYSTGPVKRIEDLHHPRGYREICTPAELRRRKHKLMAEGKLDCIHCGGSLRDCQYSEIELCHRESKGMGGAKRDDHISNIGLGHKLCNRENGSKRIA